MAMYKMTIEIEVAEDFGTFQVIEQKVLEASRLVAQEVTKRIFSDYEKRFCEKRAVQKKDSREKRYETLFGRIEFSRWRVWDVFRQKYIYPVDQWMGVAAYQHVSVGLKEEVIRQSVQRPYAQATALSNRLSGVRRSSMSNWNLVQGESIQRQALIQKPLDWSSKVLPVLKPGAPELCPILAVDPDATYVRPRRKTDKKHEIKMAVMYTKRELQNKRWVLGNKQIVMKVGDCAESLFNQATEKAVTEYGLHAGTRVIVHGDGDPWIKQYKNNYCPQALNRLDPYHVFKKIREATGAEKIPEDWYKDFYTNPSSLIKKVKELKREMADKEDRERMSQLIVYLKNNQEGMEPSGVPKEIKEKFPRMYRRGSGTIESNIFQGICQRFKAPRMMWSDTGLKNLSFLREEFLNRSFDFKKVEVLKENYKRDYMTELKEFLKEELC